MNLSIDLKYHRTPFDLVRPDKVGIVRLMNKQVYKSCFPLHEGRHDQDGPQGEKSDRRVTLYSEIIFSVSFISSIKAFVSWMGSLEELLQKTTIMAY